MGLKSLINTIIKNDSTDQFSIIPDTEGLNLVIEFEKYKTCEAGTADLLLLNQYACLQMLVEEGLAEPIRNGFVVPKEHAISLDENIRYLLKLPPRFEGTVSARVKGQSSQAGFSVNLVLSYLGEEIYNYELSGPCLKISEKEVFLLNQPQWIAFNGIKKHQQLSVSDKNEQQNLLLIYHLQQAKDAGLDIDLAQFNKLHIVHPEKIGVAVEETENGDLILTPTFGAEINPQDTTTRLGQLKGAGDVASLRIRDDIVLLDENRFKATQEILTNRRIPRDQVRNFLSTPSAFLDAALVDLDTGFSLRVKGAKVFHHGYFGETDESGIDWFGPLAEKTIRAQLTDHLHDLEELAEFEKKFNDAKAHGAHSMVFNGENIDISQPKEIQNQIDQLKTSFKNSSEKQIEENSFNQELPKEPLLEKAVVDIASNDDVLEFGEKTLLKLAEHSNFEEVINFNDYARQPFPHQEEGVRWLLGLMQCTLNTSRSTIEGALLADDMGLGKTYMSLVALSEFYRITDLKKETKKPVLIVAPLSLVENWIDETDKTFIKSPFKDIVVLQSGKDLKKFKIKGASSETKQAVSDDSTLDCESIRYSLKVGKFYGNDRLDLPQRLIVTTYQTLRDYQFSLCRIDWQLVIFDEAQNLKNPNALQTRAAKGLKARFKLLATGTPVENSLADFWCLLDTAQPGLLGSYQDFRSQFISSITQASTDEVAEVRTKIGTQLRQAVGYFMLRRLKEDQLKGLPKKNIYVGAENSHQLGWVYSPELGAVMKHNQLQAYDEAIAQIHSIQNNGSDTRGAILKALQDLRLISLHPSLSKESEISEYRLEPKIFTAQSDKILTLLQLLDVIKNKQEKVIIFIINKNLQRLLKLCLSKLYALQVHVINGDTKTVASKKGAETRKQLIADFEAKEGFGIIIMSPIAAGVGLTVIGANNVIHLERHWNPAKEAQATDRVYRIGQKKDVNIYIPILLHPKHTSFDLNLNSLLQNKIDLKDSIVTQEVVTPEEMFGVFE